MSKIYNSVLQYSRISDLIMKRCSKVADVWFCVTERACYRRKDFEDENAKKGIRMGITEMKNVIWGGKSSVLWFHIAFHG